jgi:hypothetical protein
MRLKSLINISLFPTVHLVSAMNGFGDWSLLMGGSPHFVNRVVAYVMTTATNDGLRESKLMWRLALV